MDRNPRKTLLLTALAVSAVACVALAPRSTVSTPTGKWWAYEPLTQTNVPEVVDSSWARNGVDRFILSRLEAKGLHPLKEADRKTLIRRAYYDLIGLPPTPDEVEAFLADDSEDAYERLIDRLLTSPHYGEKWGRHWLDLVRFAETDSYERDRTKPGAWKYRDYVIKSFNDDKPYDDFIIEQLAGDEIDKPTLESITATGFYRLGIWDDEPTDPLQAQYDDLDNILGTMSQVFLATTMNCARCHDHKGDPIPQRDYYRMLSFIENIKPYRELNRGNQPTYENVLKQVPVDLGEISFEEILKDYEARRRQLLRAIEETVDRCGDESLSDQSRSSVLHLTLDSLNASDVEVQGDPDLVDGHDGRAFEFDGRDDALTLKRPVQNSFTISIWFKATETGRGGTDYRWFTGNGLVDGEIPGIVRDFGVTYHSDGRITAGTGAPETFVHSPGGYNDGRWHHVAFTRNQTSGEIALFVDGESVDSATGSKDPLDTPQVITIGRMQPGGGHFRGAIDDVRFYDTALDQRAILDLVYGSGFSPEFAEIVRATQGNEEHRRFVENVNAFLELKRPERTMTEVLCVQDKGTACEPSFVRIRGNAVAKGDEVTPGFPEIFGGEEVDLIHPSPSDVSSKRRLTLAKWIASPDNPMTARVMVNRLWQFHFGRGIVPSANDFGKLGELPTHPELLDWLAAEFIESGWSVKAMHRLLMLSSAYRMSSTGESHGLEIDPQNHLYWRFNMRRLTAEEIRDSILAVNGTLNSEMGGPGVYPPMPAEVLATASRPGEAWGNSPPEDRTRRSVYTFVKRSLLPPMMTSFDLADTDQSCPVRFATTQPTQALTMMNSEFTLNEAAMLSKRLKDVAGDEPRGRVDLAFRLLTSRHPEEAEAQEAIRLIESLQTEDGLANEEAWKYFALVMLNLNEFMYLD